MQQYENEEALQDALERRLGRSLTTKEWAEIEPDWSGPYDDLDFAELLEVVQHSLPRPPQRSRTERAREYHRAHVERAAPDESILHLACSGEPRSIRAFDLVDGERISNGRIFAVVRPRMPDCFRVGTRGNLFTSAWDGIQAYNPDGELLGKVLVPEERTANCAFGGPDKRRLFIAVDRSFYSIKLNVTGVQTP